MNKKESKYFNTAKKMNDALLSLLEKKSFEFITIQDICKEAKVNRSTFYLHYDNLSDLLDEVLQNSNREFNESFQNHKKLNIEQAKKEDLYLIQDEYLYPYLNFIKEHRKLYQASKNNSHLFGLDSYSKNVYQDIILKILERLEVDQKYQEYLFSFYVSGITSIVQIWCKNECDLPVEEVVGLIKGLSKTI